jgi:hypothetical protein
MSLDYRITPEYDIKSDCNDALYHNATISALMFYHSISYHWICYTDMPPYGEGKGTKQDGWVTGRPSTYTNWYLGEPSNSGNNNQQ